MEPFIAASLDVGTTKVSVVVAEVGPNQEPSILAIGDQPCPGVDRGMIINLESTTAAIGAAVLQAETMSGLPLRRVVASVSGDHVRSLNSAGVIGVSRQDHEITTEDVDRVLDAARAVAVPGDREVLHVLPRDFSVDEQAGISDPVGMTGVRLEAEVHMITVQATALQNLVRAIERAGLEVEAIVLGAIATGESVLEPDERTLGAVLLDIGGGTTDIAVYERGSIRHTAVIGYGGRVVTQDLAVGLRTPLEEAERVKILHGSCDSRRASIERDIELGGVGGRSGSWISAQQIAEIAEPRLEEILQLAQKEVCRVVETSALGGGLVLTGGVARTPGLDKLAEQIFGLPVRIGHSVAVSGAEDLAFDPRLSTALGLLEFGVGSAVGTGSRRSGMLGRVARPVRDWIRANLPL